jgi:hypothetical protein
MDSKLLGFLAAYTPIALIFIAIIIILIIAHSKESKSK